MRGVILKLLKLVVVGSCFLPKSYEGELCERVGGGNLGFEPTVLFKQYCAVRVSISDLVGSVAMKQVV